MLGNYAVSFTDCYWITEDIGKRWNDVKISLNDVDEYIPVKEQNRMYKGINSTLGGSLEKFWYKSDGKLKLCKKVSKQFDILNIREIIASKIYENIDFPHCNYDLVYDSQNEIVGCKCEAFTSEDIELVTAYDLLEAHNMTQQDNVYELIIKYASELGLDRELAQKYMDTQTIVDYIVTNRDRHQENIGFLRDSNTLKLIDVAPVFDSGNSKEQEEITVRNVDHILVNGLYNTELECMEHVLDFNLVDISKLPSSAEIRSLLDKSSTLSEYGKNNYVEFYEKKLLRLDEMQHRQIRKKEKCR